MNFEKIFSYLEPKEPAKDLLDKIMLQIKIEAKALVKIKIRLAAFGFLFLISIGFSFFFASEFKADIVKSDIWQLLYLLVSDPAI
ncbi:MAG: hypothetical protein WCW26_04685, partial [Candidatus Buchananbacteria bacterium]